jgi:hypothetical protein
MMRVQDQGESSKGQPTSVSIKGVLKCRARACRPAASDVIDQDAAQIGVPSFLATGNSEFGTRYFFVEVRKTYIRLICS